MHFGYDPCEGMSACNNGGNNEEHMTHIDIERDLNQMTMPTMI